MPIITDAIIGGIAWEAFSKSVDFYHEKINDFVLRVYIEQQLRALEQLEGVSDEKIEEVTDIIEDTVIETPDEIKQIEDKGEQKKLFEKHIHKVYKTINNIVNGNLYGVGVAENGATVNQTFNYGDTHNHPNQ